MTSPARCTITVSPMRISLRAISSSLWSVALETTTPPTVTGFSRATGVSAPVRPTWMSMPSRTVVAFSALNLCASPQRGAARHEAQALLPVEAVDLVDDAVNVIAERGALFLDAAIIGEQFIDRAAQLHQLVDRQAPALEAFDDAHCVCAGKLRRLAPGIGEEAQRPARGDRGIELAQAARRGIARIGEDLVARLPPVSH